VAVHAGRVPQWQGPVQDGITGRGPIGPITSRTWDYAGLSIPCTREHVAGMIWGPFVGTLSLGFHLVNGCHDEDLGEREVMDRSVRDRKHGDPFLLATPGTLQIPYQTTTFPNR
jgi:hypothetical protein